MWLQNPEAYAPAVLQAIHSLRPGQRIAFKLVTTRSYYTKRHKRYSQKTEWVLYDMKLRKRDNALLFARAGKLSACTWYTADELVRLETADIAVVGYWNGSLHNKAADYIVQMLLPYAFRHAL